MTPDTANLANILTTGLTIWVLCGGALLCLLIDALWPHKMTAVIYTVGLLTLMATMATAWVQWQNPEILLKQNLLIIDLHTLFFIFLVCAVGILTLFNALCYVKIHQNLTAEFCSLVLFATVGMIFFFASDHLMVNFIGLETMSLAIYVLVGSHKKSFKSNEAAIKYFITGGVASAIFLYGIALFYGAFGTLQLSALANMLSAPGLDYLPKVALAMILVGILFKIAVVPFHFWAPDVYEGAPAPVTGFMATGVKIATFGFAIRIFIGLNVLNLPEIQPLLSVIVTATFIIGNLLAVVQSDVKRMLAYSSIAHAGFLLFGIVSGYQNGQYSVFASNTVMFYLAGYLFMTLGAFAILSLMVKEKSEATHYTDLQGLGHKHPVLAGMFALFMFSMIGIPGTVGFAAKYNIISMAVQNNHIPLAILAVLMSVVSAFYYLKPTVEMFFKKPQGESSIITDVPFTATISITLCGFLVIYLGLNPDMFIKLSQVASVGLQ